MYSSFYYWWRLKRRMRRALRAAVVVSLPLVLAGLVLGWKWPEAGDEIRRVIIWTGNAVQQGFRGAHVDVLSGDRCDIKGNISRTGARIYHVPGDRYYESTRISPPRGERWFCTEAEARAAGWRRARW